MHIAEAEDAKKTATPWRLRFFISIFRRNAELCEEFSQVSPPQMDVVKRARQFAKKLAQNLEAKCVEEAKTGKRSESNPMKPRKIFEDEKWR